MRVGKRDRSFLTAVGGDLDRLEAAVVAIALPRFAIAVLDQDSAEIRAPFNPHLDRLALAIARHALAPSRAFLSVGNILRPVGDPAFGVRTELTQ